MASSQAWMCLLEESEDEDKSACRPAQRWVCQACGAFWFFPFEAGRYQCDECGGALSGAPICGLQESDEIA